MLSSVLATALMLAAPPQVAPAAGADESVRYERIHIQDRVEIDGQWTHSMEVRVRLATVQGVAEFGQIAVPYVEGFGDVEFQDVALHKANGGRVEVKGVVEDVNPFGLTDGATPADVRVKQLTIPGLEPGDTLSYRIVHRQLPVAPARVFHEFDLPPLPDGTTQTYELDLPRAAGIRVRLRSGLASWEELPGPPDRLRRRIVVQAVRPRSEIPAPKGERRDWFEPDVAFTSFRSWSEVSSWWWAMSKERLAPDAAVAKQAAELAAGAGDARRKLAALFPFLANRIRYVNVSFGLGRMRPRFAAEVLRDRYGDCKDKHALLAALAASLGIDVRPVLVNSERDVLYDDVPGPQQFDHLISVARLGASPAEWLWLDSTNAFGPPGYLTPGLRDKPALLVESDGTAVVVRTPTDPPFLSRHETTFKGAIDAEGVLRGRAALVWRSDAETRLRAVLGSMAQEELPGTVQRVLAGDLGDGRVQNVVLSDPLDTAAPFRVEFDVEKRIAATGTERAVVPPLPGFRLHEAERSPADGPAVTFDVREEVARAEIEIPEGQQARAPLSLALERTFGTFRAAYTSEGRTLKMERALTLRQPSLDAADLAAYDAFRAAVARDGQQAFTIEGAGIAAPPAPAGAEELHKTGRAALQDKEYAQAAELLRRASEAGPKMKDVFEDLGNALYQLGRDAEAVAAFSRQIELTPFDDNAYAWRAFALQRMKREEEAEKDLLKQIEVAPFHAWSYQRMGERRLAQGRPGDAVDFFARAAAIEPKAAERWLALGEAQEAAGQPAEARASLERMLALEPSGWFKMRAAGTYRELGDVTRAGALAAAALPTIREYLARLTPNDLDEGEVQWTDQLIWAWTLVGEASADAGETARAARYLEAAWKVGLEPETAALLAEVRMDQGRLADALALVAVAVAARTTPSESERWPGEAKARARLTELRTVKLAGPALTDLTEEVLLLVGGDGAVQSVLNLSRREAEAFDRQLAKLEPIRFAWPPPDNEPFKMVRRAQLTCSAASGCALTLDPR